MLTRPHAEVRATVLPASDLPFARHLLDGARAIGAAATQALGCNAAFDVIRALTGLLAARYIPALADAIRGEQAT